MERQAKILKFCKKDGKGLEIGPSFNPVAPKSEGYDVDILDHTTADELKKKYASLGVDASKIEPVDFVWTGQPIDELIGEAGKYDWIIASHVLEHVPDPISFFRSCGKLLKSDGVLSLAIPDKRYCFDYFRWPSSTGEIWQAWIEKRKRHSAAAIFDQNSYGCKKGDKEAWDKMHRGTFRFIHDFSLIAKTFDSYREIDEYVDIHAWCFTPSSFRLILLELKQLGLIDLSEVGFHDTDGCEFFVSLGYATVNEADNAKRLAFCEQAVKEVSDAVAQSADVKPSTENLSSSLCGRPLFDRLTIIQEALRYLKRNGIVIIKKAIRYLKQHGFRKTVNRSFFMLRGLRENAHFMSNNSATNTNFDGQLITGKDGNNGGKVYFVENNRRRWIISPEVFQSSGFKGHDILTIPDAKIQIFKEGEPVLTASVLYGWDAQKKRYVAVGMSGGNAAAPLWIRVRNDLSAKYIRGEGIEIGAHYRPLLVNPDVKVRYIDILPAEENQKRFPEHAAIPVDIIDDGEILSSIENASLDFIIANHFLEHCQNPLGTIRNHLVKLRPGGILYYAIPNKNLTFDKGRPLTTFDHLRRDDSERPHGSRIEHYREWVKFVDKLENSEDIESKASQMMNQDLRIHFHVWDEKTFEGFLNDTKAYLNNEFVIECILQNGIDLIVVLSKHR